MRVTTSKYRCANTHPTDSERLQHRCTLEDTVELVAVKPIFRGPVCQILVQKVSDFSFSKIDDLRVVAQLGSRRQSTDVFHPKDSTSIESVLLLPVEQVCWHSTGERGCADSLTSDVFRVLDVRQDAALAKRLPMRTKRWRDMRSCRISHDV